MERQGLAIMQRGRHVLDPFPFLLDLSLGLRFKVSQMAASNLVIRAMHAVDQGIHDAEIGITGEVMRMPPLPPV